MARDTVRDARHSSYSSGSVMHLGKSISLYPAPKIWLNTSVADDAGEIALSSRNRSLHTASCLETQSDGQLHLPRRIRLRKLSERRRWRGGIRTGTKNIVDVGVIGAIEQLEYFHNCIDS